MIIPIEGMVKELLFTTLKRRTEAAIKAGVKVIVYRVKSDGGELGAAMEMSNYVFNLDHDIKTIAFVESKAYSAAALFSLACDDLYMKPGSAIGDCEPILPTGAGYETAGEKIQTVLKERFRTFAKTNGYPEDLAQAMVSSKIKVYSVREKQTHKLRFFRSEDWELLDEEAKLQYVDRKIVCHQDELLTLSDQEAFELGFSYGTFENSEALLKHLGCNEMSKVVDVNETEKVVDAFDQYSGLLLALGVFLLYMEFKTPGVGAFGALAALSFCAFFVSKFYQGQANYLEILLFILGLVLIGLEVFVFPGFGIAGIAGLVLLFTSLVLAMQDFNVPSNEYQSNKLTENITSVCLYFLTATMAFLFLLLLLPKGKNKDSPLHGLFQFHRQEVSQNFRNNEHQKSETTSLLGFEGKAITILCPSGKIDIDGEIYSASAREGWIAKDTVLEVVAQEGYLLTVAALKKQSDELNT